ncbi:choice-of-anchor I family protein [Thalassococcus sp. S3]|uniref:choice-of-anchor I family protein n=1 Tax=Thalassococcus sp. S3 TaxID=2017482 RepID=UPI0010241860|nr:choice-of-anchor I family protein [Thalassococcus sp. S3]QBF33372.1 bifunctional metallophosphatase/5'-nucleotidase [Thalassococcus sp. S3]
MDRFTLELLHFADQEAGAAAIQDAPQLSAVLNALRAEDLGNDGMADNTLTLSSGDAFIPGLFFDASESVYGSAGIADIEIQNQLGVQAVALGNHEFDLGTETLAGLIDGSAEGNILGQDFQGANFTYLSANLDFSTDPNMAPLEVAGGQAPQANVVTSSVIIDVNGEDVAVIGATTPTLGSIASPGTVGIAPSPFDGNPTPEQLDALAAEIQQEVDAVLNDNPGLNKVVLLSHMQRISIEEELAARLSNVDIIVAGGSNTRLVDENDRLRDGDSAQGDYPTFITNANGSQTAVVNTDGSYKYVGRLVVDFEADGNVIADSYDADVSGAYATDAQGVANLGAEDLVDPEIQQIADEIEAQIIQSESNVFGVSDVFLNANRSGTGEVDDPDGVRTQETNLGNLTADANLAEARKTDADVVISIKNGGGIRASIGETVVPAGETEAERRVNPEVVDGDGNVIKPEGGISQNDIQTTLAFNNDLVLMTLTRAEIVALLEHGVSALPDVSGQFPQLSGVKLAFDETQPAGDRITTAVIVDEDGTVIADLVSNGELAGDANETFRIVTLGFLAEPRFDDDGNFTGGGDGYPFPNTNTDASLGEVGDQAVIDRVNFTELLQEGVRDGAATFADNGTEQDALAEYLSENFGDADNAFGEEDTGIGRDDTIQQVSTRTDTVGAGKGTGELEISEAQRMDSGVGEGGSEIVIYENGKAFVTNGEEDRVDVFDVATGQLDRSIDLSGISAFDGVQSVAVANGIVAVAVSRDDGDDSNAENGVIAFFDVQGNSLGEVTVGNLPDSVAFTPDGAKVIVANEGEPIDETLDPAGSISIIDISGGVAGATAVTLDFSNVDLSEARIVGDRGDALDVEPEYVTVSPDGVTAYVTLQEANAYATVDLTTNEIVSVRSFGTIDHSLEGNGLDTSDRDDAINITTRPVQGLRMPDAIAAFEQNGQTYLVTANEGDARDLDEDEIRLADAAEDGLLDPALKAQLENAGLLDDSEMGRLNISAVDGDTDGDGDIDQLYSFGSRGFTIFNADTGAVVFDSGDDFARIVADLNPGGFNDDDGDSGEDRSDNKGVEPEAVTVGMIGQRMIAFIGLERDGGIMAYDVTDPANVTFLTYFNGREDGDVSPEGLTFVPATESPTGEPQLIAAYEVSGTTVAYDLSGLPLGGGTVDLEDGEPFEAPLGVYEDTSFTGVDDGDTFIFTNVEPFSTRDVDVNTQTGDITIRGTQFNTDADFDTGNVLAAESGQQEVTVKFIDELLGDGADLNEGQAVDAGAVDGIVFDEYLTGDGTKDFQIQIDQSGAAFSNALGAFVFDAATNTATNVQILFADVGDAVGQTATINDVADGAELVFFLIQNGESLANGLSNNLGFDFAGDLPVLLDNGTAVGAEIFHSAGAAFNSDGIEHFLSGVVDGGGALRIGIEDQLGGGDQDYQDTVFTVTALDDMGVPL